MSFTCSYALPTKTTEVLLMPGQGTKMYLDAVLKTHKRVIQVKLCVLCDLSPFSPQLDTQHAHGVSFLGNVVGFFVLF